MAARLSAATVQRLSHGLALLAFAALAGGVRAHPEPALDRLVLDWLWVPPAQQAPPVQVATLLGDARLLAAVALVLGLGWWRRGAWHCALLLVLAVLSSALLTGVLKLLIARPTTWFPLWGRLTLTADSFPSGHALQAIVFWGLLAAIAAERAPTAARRWLVVAATVTLVAGVGVTRVYLGHHWPSDVLGGWLAGWAWLGVLLALRASLAAPRPRPRAGAAVPRDRAAHH